MRKFKANFTYLQYGFALFQTDERLFVSYCYRLNIKP